MYFIVDSKENRHVKKNCGPNANDVSITALVTYRPSIILRRRCRVSWKNEYEFIFLSLLTCDVCSSRMTENEMNEKKV